MHNDYVMSMHLHDGVLISSAADRTIALTAVARHRAHVGELACAAGEEEDGEADAATAHCASHADAARRGGGGGGSSGGSSGGMGGGFAGGDGGGSSDDTLQPGGGAPLRPHRVLRGHRGEVLCVHAFDEHLASCSDDGDTLIWKLPRASGGGDAHDESSGHVYRRHRFGRIYALAMEARGVVCGGEGRTPVAMCTPAETGPTAATCARLALTPWARCAHGQTTGATVGWSSRRPTTRRRRA